MRLFLIWFIAAAAIGLGALSVEAATDSQMMAKNCWVDVFDDTKYDADDPHVRVQGPIELSSLKDLQGRNWSNEIQSVIVGPDASVRAYKDKEFKGTELAFAPGQRVPDLSKLNMSDDIESLKVSCNDPR